MMTAETKRRGRGKGKIAAWTDGRAEEPIKVYALTLAEAARALRVSKRTVESLMASGELHCRHIGKLVRFRPADIEEFMQREQSSGKKKAARKG